MVGRAVLDILHSGLRRHAVTYVARLISNVETYQVFTFETKLLKKKGGGILGYGLFERNVAPKKNVW